MPLLCFWHRQQLKNPAVALQRMPLLSRVTMQKGAQDRSKSKPTVTAHVKKQALASFTFAERASPLYTVPPTAGDQGGKSTAQRGLLFFLYTPTQ